jgi:hypothetical protein
LEPRNHKTEKPKVFKIRRYYLHKAAIGSLRKSGAIMKTTTFLCGFFFLAMVALAWSIPAFCGEIHDAAKSGDLAKVQALLKENPKVVFSKDALGYTPLHMAAWKARNDVVELLLANKAEVNARDSGVTPLHLAAAMGTRETVKLLLANKAEVNARDTHGYTSLHCAADEGNKDVDELLDKRAVTPAK